MSFENIIGHSNIKKQIQSSIESNKFSHAHIIVGEDGIGKSVLAKEIAVRLIGKKEVKQYADISNFRVAENKKSIGVDEIRELIDEISKKPFEGENKVIIFFEGDKITEAAQNAFLKTIEEPPKGVFILLLCENLDKILPTIKSRCQIHNLNRLNEFEIKEFIVLHNKDVEESKMKQAILFSDGIPGRADKFLKDNTLNEIRTLVADIIQGINKKSLVEMIKYDEALAKYKSDYKELLTWFLCYIRDALVYKETGNSDLIMNIDKFNIIKDIAEMFSFNKLSDIIDIIEETRLKLYRNVNVTLTFQSMLIKLKEV